MKTRLFMNPFRCLFLLFFCCFLSAGQAQSETYNAGIVLADFSTNPGRVNVDLKPYVSVINLGDTGTYMILLEIYKSSILKDERVNEQVMGPVEIARNERYSEQASFSTDTEGKYYPESRLKRTLFGIHSQVLQEQSVSGY